MATNASRVLEGLRAANVHSNRPGKWSSVWEVTERTPNASNIQVTLNSLVHSGRAVTKNGLYKVSSIYSSLKGKGARGGTPERGKPRGERGEPDRGKPRGDDRRDDPRKTPERGTPRDTVRRTADVMTTMLFGGTSGGSSGGGTNTGRL